MNEVTLSKLSRRTFLQATAGLASLAALAACAAPGAAPAAGGNSAAPSGESVEVTFMGWGGTEEDEGVKSAITQFESEQDKVKVTWLHTPELYHYHHYHHPHHHQHRRRHSARYGLCRFGSLWHLCQRGAAHRHYR